MLGGVTSSQTCRFGREQAVRDRLAGSIEINASVGIEVVGEIYASTDWPEIFPHCPGAHDGVVHGRCHVCGGTITIKDAKAFEGVPYVDSN